MAVRIIIFFKLISECYMFRSYRPSSGNKIYGLKHKYVCRDKGKAIPLQAWTGPEGSRTLRLPDFKTIGT